MLFFELMVYCEPPLPSKVGVRPTRLTPDADAMDEEGIYSENPLNCEPLWINYHGDVV